MHRLSNEFVGDSAPSNSLYADSPAISTVVVFVHLAAIIVGGGTAFGSDRRALHCIGAPDERAGYLASAPVVHRTITLALAVVMTAGALLFLANVEALACSAIFHVKLLLVVLLLANGFAIMRVESRLCRGSDTVSKERAWLRLGVTARTSQTLWFATVLAGAALRNI